MLTAGCGGMGGAQPLAVTMLDGVCLVVDVDARHLERRVEQRYLDLVAPDLDAALREAEEARAAGDGRSIGIVGSAGEVFRALLERGVVPDIVTDQTSAHDPLGGYVPDGLALEDAAELRESDPQRYIELSRASMAAHCAAMVEFQERGSEVFDYGNSLRAEARTGGFDQAFAYPGFVEAYVRPLFCTGTGPFRWAALSGDPDDIAATDAAVGELFPENAHLQRWLELARTRIAYQGLPARICWLGYGERHRAGLRFNELVRSGEVSAPIVIGRDHLDSGSVASPYRETEGMMDGSDAIADWPILNALLGVSSGAAWVAVHHGGGVGIGRSMHSGVQVVADGTDEGALRVERVLTNDPGTGVMRHADAGYAWRARRRGSAVSTCRCCRDPHAARPRPRARAGRRRARRARARAGRRSHRRGRRRGGSGGARRRAAAAGAPARPGPRERALARVPAPPARARRGARRSGARGRFLVVARSHVRSGRGARPAQDARRRRGVLRAGRRAGYTPSASSTTSTTTATARPTRSPTSSRSP